MTHDLKVAVAAINKWLYFGLNYDFAEYRQRNCWGEESVENIPAFILAVDWTFDIDNIVARWHFAISQKDSTPDIVKFYVNLDCRNRERLLEWVVKNYSDEDRIYWEAVLNNISDVDRFDKIHEWAENKSVHAAEDTASSCMYKAGYYMGKAEVLSMLTGRRQDKREVNRLVNKAMQLL